MSDNRGQLARLTDTFTVDNFFLGQHLQPNSGIAIPSGDYSAADPLPAEFGLLGVQGICIVVDITAQSGAGNTLTVNVELYDFGRSGGAPLQNLGFFVGLTNPALTGGPQTVAITIDPWTIAGTGAVGGFGASSTFLQRNVGRLMRIRPVKSGTTTTLTYSVGLHTI